MSNLEKSLKIKATMANNKVRRAALSVKVFELKIDESHVSKRKIRLLNDCFIQAKWIYNYIISNDNIFDFNSKIKEIEVNKFNPESQKCDIIVNRPLTIGSQIKQSIVDRAIQNVYNLAKAKRAGLEVGKLKVKKEITSIPLKQFGVTFKIKNDKYISIQGIGTLKVNGLYQIKGFDIANATLIKKASGYFVKVTIYKEKEIIEKNKESIGIDFGIKDSIILSNGEKYNYNFEIPKELKNKQRKLSKKKKGSKNYVKQCKRIKKSYEKYTNKKNDAANKLVSKLKKYDKVIFQDENLKGWHTNLFGKQVQQSILGRIKTRLKELETSIMIDRWLPTTKMSPIDGKIINPSLNDRIYQDGDFIEDRDVKSAKTILCFGLYNPKLTRKELMSLPAEAITSIFSNYMFENNKLSPMKQEATAL